MTGQPSPQPPTLEAVVLAVAVAVVCDSAAPTLTVSELLTGPPYLMAVADARALVGRALHASNNPRGRE